MRSAAIALTSDEKRRSGSRAATQANQASNSNGTRANCDGTGNGSLQIAINKVANVG